MFRTTLALALIAGSSQAALADMSLAISIDLDEATLQTLHYDCGSGGRLAVHYINSETDALALVPVDDDERVFVNVVSGSGARYVSGEYEWWTKGEDATLRNTVTDQQVMECGPDNG